MTKVLIGNSDIQTDLKDFQFLKNSSEYEIIYSNSGRETIDICRTISPNIIILDSNISDMVYTDIIDIISELPDENNKCNLILKVNDPKEKQLLTNTSIIYGVFDSSSNIEMTKEAINYLTRKYKTPDVTTSEIRDIISKLGIFPYSDGANCLISAICKCYYHPEYFSTLDNLYRKIVPECEFTIDEIKNKIRHSIDTINTSTNIDGSNLYFEIFGHLAKPSSKVFILMFVNYLHKIKGKK